MREEVTVLEILNRLEQKVSIIKGAVENNDIDRLREEAACSLICGDETIITDKPVLDENFCFKYKGLNCELSACNSITTIDQITGLNNREEIHKRFPNSIFTDRYVCWVAGHKDIEGKTLKEYLEANPGETESDNSWAPHLYLVPEAWAYGAKLALKPGEQVEELILDGISQFLEQNPDL